MQAASWAGRLVVGKSSRLHIRKVIPTSAEEAEAERANLEAVAAGNAFTERETGQAKAEATLAVGQAEAEAMARAIPRCRLVVVDGSNHYTVLLGGLPQVEKEVAAFLAG